MSRGLHNSITMLLKIKVKVKMKVALAFLPKVWLKKFLICFILEVPFCLFFSFILFKLVFYFIFIDYFRLYLKLFSFILAAFKKIIIFEDVCAKRLVGSSNFGYMVYH